MSSSVRFKTASKDGVCARGAATRKASQGVGGSPPSRRRDVPFGTELRDERDRLDQPSLRTMRLAYLVDSAKFSVIGLLGARLRRVAAVVGPCRLS